MADAEEIADKVLAAIGGIGGAIVGVAGGGDGGAKATQQGVDAIRGIVSDATGRTERKRAEAKEGDRADRELEKQRLALEERKLKLEEEKLRAQTERDKIRAYDAPMFPARPRGAQPAATALSWQPSTLNPDDRIVEIVDRPDKSPPLVNDARQSVILRRGDSREVVLVDAGPLVDGAAPKSDRREAAPTERPPLVAYAADPKHFERAGEPRHVDAAHTPKQTEG
jgi:hypothetical protein